MSSARPAYVFLLAMAICFGGTWPAGKLAVEELEPFTVAAARFVLAAVLLGVWAARRGSLRLPALSDLPIVLAMGATAVAGYNVLFLYGLELAPATDGAIIVPGFAPVFAVLVGWVALGERSSRRALLGLVVALGGLVAVVDPSGTIDSDRVAGAAIFMAGALCWGIYSHIGKPATARFGAVTATFYATAAGALMLIPFSLAERLAHSATRERTPGCRSAISPCSGPCSRSSSSTRGFAASGLAGRLVCPADSDLRRALVRGDPR